jgi:5'-nucleotidase
MDASQISRKSFIKISGGLAAGAILANLPISTWASTHTIKLTILHTNDWHSRIEPFDDKSGRNAGMGGAAIRSKVIQNIREQEEHILLLDAGDVFQGTPYFNMFGGELEFNLMSKMQYDAFTLGNHDFDNGVEGLVKQLPFANFPIINSNYDVRNTPLEGNVLQYKIFNKGPLKIGVLGVGIDLYGLVPNALLGDVKYTDPIAAANTTAALLKTKHKCNLVICLSHLGYKYNTAKVSDLVLASQSRNIDLIIGGHTHTFLPSPDKISNADKKAVLVNQVGWGGMQLGRIDFYFDAIKGHKTKFDSASITLGENTV